METQTMIRVAVDAMGGDNAPAEVIKGTVSAVCEDTRVQAILVGKEDVINEHLFFALHIFIRKSAVRKDRVIQKLRHDRNDLRQKPITAAHVACAQEIRRKADALHIAKAPISR